MSRSISVHTRLRPLKPSDGPTHPIQLSENAASVKGTRFMLDRCHGDESTQEEVFEGVKPIMEQVYRGINTTVFAYGVTGSGKTWTMQGSPSDPGVIPRVVKHIFLKKSRLRKSSLKISFSYVEILCEEIYDLLIQRKGAEPVKKLDVRTTATGENVIADLTRKEIVSVAEFDKIYNQAALGRKTASTNLNSTSSRSHAVLTLYVETTELSENKTYMGKICLVDLAGSEDNNLTGNDPIRMRESAAINRSLTTLGNVVEALNNGSSRIPYRDSKLTRILQDALGGNSQGMLICNLAPGEKYVKDTLRTLKFATRTREIENRPVVNERDDRVLPAPHFSQPTRPTMKSSTLPSNAIAGPSRPSATSTSSIPHSATATFSQPPHLSRVGTQIRREAAGLSLTEEQLNDRIERVVKEVMGKQGRGAVKEEGDEQEKEKEEVKVKAMAKEKEGKKEKEKDDRGVDLSRLTEEDIKSRAKVLTNLARDHHDKNELDLALKYYKEARVYMPQNDRLQKRITEIELALEGKIPIPSRGGVKVTSPGKRKREEPKLRRSAARESLTDLAKEQAEPEQARAVFGVKRSNVEVVPVVEAKGKGRVQASEVKVVAVEKTGRAATKKAFAVYEDDSYCQSEVEADEDEYVPQQPKRAKRKINNVRA